MRRLAGAVAALVLALSLSSCSVLTSLDASPGVSPSSPVEAPANLAATLDEALDALASTETFTAHGTEHVLSGEINRKGAAVGYHSTALGDLAAGQILPGTASAADGHGLYEAQVSVSGTNKTSNDGYSTFFPASWTAQQVVDAINEAYGSRVSSGDGGYDGVTSGGITVHMYLDDSDLITTAYPVMEN
ncbi:EndoU nuclease [Sanguibacter gelidistatuariae]|uniref:EndoU nuclease n=1 Tax=Sanguibacter gelidistatuariae TaxID=1814289 RepID=A0A1G6WDK0_9MICO|nr:EndoU domain-containing protein [Sanguibacter gelidistatuariae]SDD63834.1 EndoU nuclease [Sanguibacter gelidistatuariae]